MRNKKTSETIRRIPWRLVLLCGGTLLLFGAAPASADSNFERGFERELGRILAHEAVNAGKAVLFQGVVHPYAHQGHQQAISHRYYDDRRDRRHWRKLRERRHRQWLRRQHRRHHGHSFKRYVRDDYYYDDDDDHRRHRKHKKQRKHHRGDGCNDHY